MDELQTYWLYGATAIVSLLFCWYSERTNKKRGLVAAAILLIFVSGFRAYSVGVDTSLYKTGIEYFCERGEVLWSSSFAYGYGVFTRFLLTLNKDYTFVLVAQAAITHGLILARFWDLRKRCSLTFMLFAYICTTYFYTFCIICQYVAVALVFWGSRYADRGKILPYTIVIIFASCLHVSALVALIDVAMRLVKLRGVSPLKALLQVLALVCICVVGMYGAGLFSDRYSSYVGNSSSVGLMVFVQIFVLLVCLLACGYFAKKRSVDNLSLRNDLESCAPYALRLYSLGLLLSAASYVIANAGRIAYYFTIYGCVCFGAMAKHSTKSRSRLLCAIFLVAWLVAYCSYACFINSALGIVPYSFVWG